MFRTIARKIRGAALPEYWEKDECHSGCMNCGQSFAGNFLFVRRHHCRKCGVLVCGRCWSEERGMWCTACTVDGELDRGGAVRAVEVQLFPTSPLTFARVTDELGVSRIAVAHTNLPHAIPVGSYVLSHNSSAPDFLLENDPMSHMHSPIPTLLVMPRIPSTYLLHMTAIPRRLYRAITSQDPGPPEAAAPGGAGAAPTGPTLYSWSVELHRVPCDTLRGEVRSPVWRSAPGSAEAGWSLALYEHSSTQWRRWGLRHAEKGIFITQSGTYAACGQGADGDADPLCCSSSSSASSGRGPPTSGGAINASGGWRRPAVTAAGESSGWSARAAAAPPLDASAVCAVLPDDVPTAGWKACTSFHRRGGGGGGGGGGGVRQGVLTPSAPLVAPGTPVNTSAATFDIKDVSLRFIPVDTEGVAALVEESAASAQQGKRIPLAPAPEERDALARLEALRDRAVLRPGGVARNGGAPQFWGRVAEKVSRRMRSAGGVGPRIAIELKKPGGWAAGKLLEVLPASHAVLASYLMPAEAGGAPPADLRQQSLLSVDLIAKHSEIINTRASDRVRPRLAGLLSQGAGRLPAGGSGSGGGGGVPSKLLLLSGGGGGGGGGGVPCSEADEDSAQASNCLASSNSMLCSSDEDFVDSSAALTRARPPKDRRPSLAPIYAAQEVGF